jgi:hypothetical protein
MSMCKAGCKAKAGRVVAVAATVMALAGGVALPQALAQAPANPTVSNAIPESESVTLQATIRGINRKTREVRLVGRSGASVTVTAGPAVRLELLKVGDKVTVQYYRSVAFLVNAPQGGNGTPTPSNDGFAALVARPAQAPGGVAVAMTTLTGLVVGIDRAANRIEVVNPSGGGVVSIDVTDPSRAAMLPQLKVGDRITAAVSETLAISIQPAPKGWF